jgi:RNA polymerase sigma-70 factor (ECF subfamily)
MNVKKPGRSFVPSHILKELLNYFLARSVTLLVVEPEPDRSHVVDQNQVFHNIVEPELAIMLRVARGITRSSIDADDLVQESVIRAFNSLSTFDGQHPRAWLLTIMRNTNINMHRRKRPALVDDFTFLEPYPLAFGSVESKSAEDTSIQNNLSEEIIQGLKSLDLKFREVLYLVDIEGLNYGECSAILGKPVGTVTSRLSRARTKLRKYLIDNEAFEGRYS